MMMHYIKRFADALLLQCYLRRKSHTNDNPAKRITLPIHCDRWANLQITKRVQTAHRLIQRLPCHVTKIRPL